MGRTEPHLLPPGCVALGQHHCPLGLSFPAVKRGPAPHCREDRAGSADI